MAKSVASFNFSLGGDFPEWNNGNDESFLPIIPDEGSIEGLSTSSPSSAVSSKAPDGDNDNDNDNELSASIPAPSKSNLLKKTRKYSQVLKRTEATEEASSASNLLHRYLRTAEWKLLLEAILKLQSAGQNTIQSALSCRNELGETPLHVAAWKAPPRLALLMLELVPTDVCKQLLLTVDDDGNTPLHLACANLDETVEFAVIKNVLLLAPDSLEMQNLYGDTPLHLLVCSKAFAKSSNFAVEAAAEEATTSLLMMVGHLAIVKNDCGLTLLHIAIAHGAHERVLVKLLSLGPAAAQVRDQRGMLPVHYVAAFGGTPWTFVRQLLQTSAESCTAQTENGDTPLHLLMSNAKKNLVQPKKHRFVNRNTIKLAELFVGGKTPSNSSGSSGSSRGGGGGDTNSPLLVLNTEYLTPLHCCALFDTPPQLTKSIMSSPYAKQASVLTTQFGATALHLACASSRVADSLNNLEAIATPEACDIKDFNDRTPLMVAVQNSRATGDVIKTLTEAYPKGAAISSELGLLPLHLAVQSSKVRESTLRPLLEAYPDSVYHVTKTGNTALHEACAHGAPPAVLRLLIMKNPGAVKVVNDAGGKPVDCALKGNAKEDILALLGDSGARQTADDSKIQYYDHGKNSGHPRGKRSKSRRSSAVV